MNEHLYIFAYEIWLSTIIRKTDVTLISKYRTPNTNCVHTSKFCVTLNLFNVLVSVSFVKAPEAWLPGKNMSSKRTSAKLSICVIQFGCIRRQLIVSKFFLKYEAMQKGKHILLFLRDTLLSFVSFRFQPLGKCNFPKRMFVLIRPVDLLSVRKIVSGLTNDTDGSLRQKPMNGGVSRQSGPQLISNRVSSILALVGDSVMQMAQLDEISTEWK